MANGFKRRRQCDVGQIVSVLKPAHVLNAFRDNHVCNGAVEGHINAFHSVTIHLTGERYYGVCTIIATDVDSVFVTILVVFKLILEQRVYRHLGAGGNSGNNRFGNSIGYRRCIRYGNERLVDLCFIGSNLVRKRIILN